MLVALYNHAPRRPGPFAKALQTRTHTEGREGLRTFRFFSNSNSRDTTAAVAFQDFCGDRRYARISALEVFAYGDDCPFVSLLRRGHFGRVLWPASVVVHEGQRIGCPYGCRR